MFRKNMFIIILLIYFFNSPNVFADSSICDSRFCVSIVKNNAQLTNIKEAQTECKNQNSFLLEMYNDRIYNLVLNLTMKNTMLNYQDILHNVEQSQRDQWFALDGSDGKPYPLSDSRKILYDDFSRNFVALARRTEDQLYEFRASFGHEKGSAICSKRITQTECDSMTERHFYRNNTCYFISIGTFTWFEAQNECNSRNSTMASFMNIDNSDKNVFSNFDQFMYWVGITRNLWLWQDSSSYANFSRWFLGKPTESTGVTCNYFKAGENGNMWLRKSCQNKFAILCMTDNQRMTDKQNPPSTSSGALLGILLTLAIIVVFVVGAVIYLRRKEARKKHVIMQVHHVQRKATMRPEGKGYDQPI